MSSYPEFMERSPEDIVLAIFDRLGVKLTPGFNHDDKDTTWADGLIIEGEENG